MTIQVSDHRWTQDTLEQLTVSGPVTFTGTVTQSGGAQTFTSNAVATVPVTITGFSAAQTGDLIDIFQNGTTNSVFKVSTVASAVNGILLGATATGNNPTFTAGGGGSDTNLGVNFVMAGTGTAKFSSGTVAAVPVEIDGFSTAQTGDLLDVKQNSGGNKIFTVGTAASAANGVGILAVAASSNPSINAIGTDSNIALLLQPKGAPGATGGVIAQSVSGTTTVPLVSWGGGTSQTGDLFACLQTSGGNSLFRVATGTSAANGVVVTAKAASTPPIISAGGSGADANTDLVILGNGTGSLNVGVGTNIAGNGLRGLVYTTVAAASGIANTDTYFTSTAANLVAANTLKAGSLVRFTLHGSCNSSTAQAQTFTLRMGTAGTTADASAGTFALTSVASAGATAFEIVITVVIQTLGAGGTGFGTFRVNTAAVATGITGVNGFCIANNSLTPATSTATHVGLSYISGAATTTTTFQDCIVEILS